MSYWTGPILEKHLLYECASYSLFWSGSKLKDNGPLSHRQLATIILKSTQQMVHEPPSSPPPPHTHFIADI